MILTSPIYITLKENESLIIPKYWWHWVTSNNQTIGINFWVKKDFIDYKKPEKISTSFQNNNLINDILFNYNEPVEVFYKSENGEGILIKKKINDLDLSIDNYLYTVPYLLSNKHKHVNTELHSKFEKFINIPDFAKNNDYEYNIWYSTGTHETGLHYDDNDNLLSVIK